MKKPLGKNALLEIGVEELPARFIDSALEQLGSLAKNQLEQAGLEFDTLQVYGTPRRLALFIENLSAKAKDRVDIAIGPPPAAAKSPDGQWTQVALGFAKAQKVNVNKLEVRQTPKGERIVALHAIKGQTAEQILKGLYPALIQKLAFPKSMAWEVSRFRFARPIRWIAALYNGNVVRFQLAGVSSDRQTYGLLAQGAQKITIPKPEKYKALLQSRCMLVDPKDRRANILRQLEQISKKVKGTPVAEAAHVDEVVHLNEYPTGILGQFQESYLTLPKEILISVMRKHQKYFPIEASRGKLSNYFIGIRNGMSEHQEVVREGYERVLAARLADAQFFYEQDLKHPLNELVTKLSGVGYHPKLGSLLDKTNRMERLAEKLAARLSFSPESSATAKRAAHLAKADLLTQMVGEFPELQGIAGRFYSEKSEASTVAQAVEQHYWPAAMDGALPTTSEAAVVALSDKLDTVAAHISVGLIPSGSADPYALRRASIGLIRILLDQKWDLSIDDLLQETVQTLPKEKAVPNFEKDVKAFLLQRVSAWFENQGYRADEVEAALNSAESLSNLQEKLKGIKLLRGKPEFESLSIAIKRATNILKQARDKGITGDGVTLSSEELGPQEKTLNEALEQVRPKLSELVQKKHYQQALLELSPLKGPVDEFFNGVMVMVDDEKLRAQRLALLQSVKHLFDSVADFSKLQTASPSKS